MHKDAKARNAVEHTENLFLPERSLATPDKRLIIFQPGRIPRNI